MGRTLFWYVFKDLLKIFFMTSGALAGIMSFGGLLRPLTQQGLDAGQVGKMLAYFTPAMTAYSFPIAALFAATMVYGRLSADNELTACRAGGIPSGITGMALPALLFGLLVAIISMAFLSFIVPIYTLKVEKVVYSNLAKLIANRIEREHQVKFGDYNIFAVRAVLPPSDGTSNGQQVVVLQDVSIVTYDKAKARGDSRYRYPKQFLIADSATLQINERPDDQVDLLIGLQEGTKFPREHKGGSQAGVGTTQFGPIEIPSPIKEDPKFMDVWRLKRLYHRPEESRRIATAVSMFVRHDQIITYLEQIRAALDPHDAQGRAGGARRFVFDRQGGQIIITLNDDRIATTKDPHTGKIEDRWVLQARHEGEAGEELVVQGEKPGTITFERQGDQPTVQTARELRLRVRPDTTNQQMHVTIELLDRSPRPGARPISGNYSEVITVPMDQGIQRLQNRRLAYYHKPGALAPTQLSHLKREEIVLSNGILSESNNRASFAVSCLILVMVGCALGTLFRSGNFLTAFAVSFIPALLCITLIVAGQQTCHQIPWTHFENHNPLRLGLTLIWSGNAINCVIAVYLLFKLQRQ